MTIENMKIASSPSKIGLDLRSGRMHAVVIKQKMRSPPRAEDIVNFIPHTLLLDH